MRFLVQKKEEITSLDDSWQWIVGDLMLEGERIFGDQIMQSIEQKDKYLLNLKYVSKAINPSIRRKPWEVPYSTHYAVAPLAPERQEYFLTLAHKGGLSRRDLQRAIKEELQSPVKAPQPSSGAPETEVGLFLPLSLYERLGNVVNWYNQEKNLDLSMAEWLDHLIARLEKAQDTGGNTIRVDTIVRKGAKSDG